MKCSLDECKKKFYRAANGIFGKIGRTASEDVILKLISSKCIGINHTYTSLWSGKPVVV